MKRLIPYAVAAAGLAAAVVFCLVLVGAVWYSPQQEIVFAEEPALPPDPPKHLRIPALGVDARVQHAGLLPGNRMASPTNFTDVAWYKYGPSPGMLGSAVIAGHLDNGLGLPGVFKDLEKISPGEEVVVETESGEERRFVVERVEVYPYDQVPKSVFTADDRARLNLVSCAGNWIKTGALGWTVDKRLVVYATLLP